MKRIYWHLPIAMATPIALILLMEALFPRGLSLSDRLGFPLSAGGAALGAGLIAERLTNARRPRRVRFLLWRGVSLLFLLQLLLGLFVSSTYLGNGSPTLPHPLFAHLELLYPDRFHHHLFLWSLSLLLLGSSYCSFLCWFGSWDMGAALGHKGRPQREGFSLRQRLLVALLVFAGGTGFALFAPLEVVLGVALLWILGAGVTLVVSRRTGRMVHCTLYCPVGTLTTLLSRLSPFRIYRESGKTTKSSLCLYGVLDESPSGRGALPHSCTLCTDCLEKRAALDLRLRFLGFRFDARPLFYALVSGFVAAFGLLVIP